MDRDTIMTDGPELLTCPFCGGGIRIGVCDYEGNLHPEEYENDPWSGLSFALLHSEVDAIGPCAIATHGEEVVGMFLYDTRAEAVAAWNRRADGWTSVEDALPELSRHWIDGHGNPILYSAEVLVCKAGAWKALATYDERHGWITDAGDRAAGVTHWMYAEPPPGDAQDD